MDKIQDLVHWLDKEGMNAHGDVVRMADITTTSKLINEYFDELWDINQDMQHDYEAQ